MPSTLFEIWETENGNLHIVYRDEPIISRPVAPNPNLPALLRQARKLALNDKRGNSLKIFLKQGKLLARYKDDFEFEGDPVRYYPTYQSLTDAELRGYFSWRTKLRKGLYAQTPLTFIYLYIYELINNIGATTPMDGYEKLLEVFRHYAEEDNGLRHYLKRWLNDYIIYYDLPRELLDTSENTANQEAIKTLDTIADKKDDEIIDAVKQLAPKWLNRSRFYASHYEEMDTIICRVLKKMAARYEKTCVKKLVDQLFGQLVREYYPLFSQAVFCNPLKSKRKDFTYVVNAQHIYECHSGIWMVLKRNVSPYSARRLEQLLKTIDSLMRVEYGDKHAVKTETRTKWIKSLIIEEIRNYRHERQAAEKARVKIDFSSLDKIRKDAAVTQERLIVDEELEDEAAPAILAEASAQPEDELLNPQEKRLLHCLLEGRSLDWIQEEGLFVSVLVDQINAKLYETFGDTVLDDTPEILPDYREDLMEMFSA